MELASNEALAVLNYLLPGLVATWSFRRLTPHDKPKDLEAVVEALLFTAAVQAVVVLIEIASVWLGSHVVQLGIWSGSTTFVVSMILGLAIGSASGIAANKDWVHGFLRNHGLTKQTSFPSEWYRQLFCEERYVILNMRNGDRILGWPSEFPNSPERGHFNLRLASWLPPEGDPLELRTAECILVPAAEVLYVEFMKTEEEAAREQEATAAVL